MDENSSCPQCGRPYGQRRRCYYCQPGRRRVGDIANCKVCGSAYEVPKIKDRSQSARCLDCRRRATRERMARWRERNPERAKAAYARASTKYLSKPENLRKKREREIRRVYGIEPEELNRLLVAQADVCAICGLPPRGRANGRSRPEREPRLHVDHDHITGKVRGLLCGNCNTMIGLANEDPEILRAAIEYLKKE